MKICIDGVVREMTPEEEKQYYPVEDEIELSEDEAFAIITGESA